MSEFRLPDVGEGLDEAEIIEWFVSVGDQVEEHQVLVSVETAKSIVEIPSPRAGTISAVGGAVGDSVPVGAMLVEFEGAEPATTSFSSEDERSNAQVHATPPATPTGVVTQPAGPHTDARPKAAPVVRRIAAERGIDLREVRGTGPRGRILRADLDRDAAPAVVPSAEVDIAVDRSGSGSVDHAPGALAPLRGLRRSIAQNMAHWMTIPHVSDFREVDGTRATAGATAAVEEESRETLPPVCSPSS